MMVNFVSQKPIKSLIKRIWKFLDFDNSNKSTCSSKDS